MADQSTEASLHGSVIVAFPYYPNNPWQRILYDAAVSSGATVLPLNSLEGLVELPIPTQHARSSVLHVNWTGPVGQLADDILRSASRVRTFLRTASEFQRAGGRIVWSIHNVLPHELRFRLPELLLMRELARVADKILVMTTETVEEIRDFCALDGSKVEVIPHPNYVSDYPNSRDRKAARAHFGISDDAIVALALGVIRPYKNIDLVVEAFVRAHRRQPRLRLLVAGEVGYGIDASAIRETLQRAGAIFRLQHVPDEEVQLWMNAADFAVFAFSEVLNSGSIMVAAGFGLPAVMPGLPSLQQLTSLEWVTRVDTPVAPASLERSLLSAADAYPGNTVARSSALAYAASRDPKRVSEEFAALLERLLTS